jgi:hypothetical protein
MLPGEEYQYLATKKPGKACYLMWESCILINRYEPSKNLFQKKWCGQIFSPFCLSPGVVISIGKELNTDFSKTQPKRNKIQFRRNANH